MKDSIGMVPALVAVFIAVTLISGYLAFTINYSKAFKAKSRIINLIQSNKNEVDNDTISNVQTYLSEIKYSTTDMFVKNGCNSKEWNIVDQQGWCWKEVVTKDEKDDGSGYEKKYIKIRTFISIDIPIMGRFFSTMPVFYVDGSTKSTIVYKKA